MKQIKWLGLVLATFFFSANAVAQSAVDSLRNKITLDSLQYVSEHIGEIYGKDNNSGISTTKLFMIMIPSTLLLIFFIVILAIYRLQANKQLKIKMIERGISEENLVQLFKTSTNETVFGALKWALVLVGLGAGLAVSQSFGFGALSFGIVTIFAGIGFFIYYLIMKKRV
jgi:hypothetical protein